MGVRQLVRQGYRKEKAASFSQGEQLNGVKYAGYAHLINQDSISAIAPAIIVEVRSVTRKETIGQTIAVPAKLVPAPDDRLGHVLFAIKHEGINLQVLAQALPAIPEPEIRQAFDAAPNSHSAANWRASGVA
ncbi:hypothetical protein Q667_19415 [Marinobacter sp. C1S70]|uniref:hypothetical protein n=1 Tax=Marinobacter sp. C1S70 TaxID=1396859 RepID=UPI0003B81424|nr:hypothetical protein [Marinobacter sp. C1S70]ERS81903.1 hypothetical protein Q667_19415 [Marinobacter sp. C1S70]